MGNTIITTEKAFCIERIPPNSSLYWLLLFMSYKYFDVLEALPNTLDLIIYLLFK